MFYSFKNRGNLENFNKLVSLLRQKRALGLQDKLGKQYFHEALKKVFASTKDVSEDVTQTMMVISDENNKAPSNSNDQLSEIFSDSGILTSYSFSFLCKFTNPEHTSQFTLMKILIQIESKIFFFQKNNTCYCL